MLRARTFTTINDLKAFFDSRNIGREDVLYQSSNSSGAHDVVYNDKSDGGGSLKEGTTAAERAVYDEIGVDAPLNATRFVAGGATMTFAASGGTLTRSAGSWLSAGFLPGMKLTIAGTASNDGDYYIESVTTTVITIQSDASTAVDSSFSDTFTNEGPLSGGETADAEQWGYDTKGVSYIHVVSYLPDSSTSLDYQLYTWDSASEQWTLDTRPGTLGVVGVADTDTDNPKRLIIEVPGVEKVAIVVSSSTGTFTTGYSFWILGAQ